jgi:hypothetical protein
MSKAGFNRYVQRWNERLTAARLSGVRRCSLRRVQSWWVAVLAALLLLGSGCTSSGSGSAQTRAYPLWSNGWKPGDIAYLGRIDGPFHAHLEHSVVCAWLGDKENPTRWPAGWSVRLNPTVLLDPAGNVVAHEGDMVSGGGGTFEAADAQSRCGPAGDSIWDIAGKISAHG